MTTITNFVVNKVYIRYMNIFLNHAVFTMFQFLNSIVVICSDVAVLVMYVVVLFAANMSVIIMSLEFGRRPTKKF